MLDFYKMTITDEDDGMDFIALVDRPAHQKSFEFFNEKVKQVFNEEERIVTGVAIAVDVPIYRNDEFIGEHYVVFGEKETFQIANRMMNKGYMHNVNEMHDNNRQVKGMTLVESYFIDEGKGKNVPNAFKNQNLRKGSWIVSYYVDNDKVWNDIKQGKHIGFSIEGYFSKEKINIKKTNNKMGKTTNKIKELVFKVTPKAKFESALTVDGVEVYWEGELSSGTALMVKDEDGNEVLAPEGTHSIQNGESIVVVSVDGSGIVSSIEEVEAEMEEEMSREEVAEAMSALKSLIEDKFNEVSKENKELKTKVEFLENEITKTEKGKFNQGGKLTKKGTASYREILKKK